MDMNDEGWDNNDEFGKIDGESHLASVSTNESEDDDDNQSNRSHSNTRGRKRKSEGHDDRRRRRGRSFSREDPLEARASCYSLCARKCIMTLYWLTSLVEFRQS